MLILLIEDDELKSSAMERILNIQKIGCKVLKAVSTDRAIRLLGSMIFDIVLMDYNLSESTSEEVATFIASRKKNERPHKVMIHSSDHDGILRLQEILKDFQPKTIEVPQGLYEL